MTRALLFDLGDVLVGLDFERAYRAAARLCPYSPAEIRDRLRGSGLAERYETGRLTSRGFFENCRALLRLEADFEQFRRLWGDMFSEAPLVSDELLAGLAARHRMVIVSNTNEIHFEFIRERHRRLERFERFVLSHEVGAMKPQWAFYEAAAAAAECLPAECYLIDDRLENVEGARRFGMRATVFRGEDELRANLAAAGVDWR